MALNRLKPTSVNSTATFSFANLSATGNITSANANLGNLVTSNYFAGTLTTGSQPNITSVGSLANLSVAGLATVQQTTEKIVSITGATGTVTHDFSSSSVFFHTSISANFTANFTNFPTTEDRVTVLGLFLVQGSTPYYANSIQINGTTQTILWAGASAPTVTASRKEVQSFTVVRSGGSWYVYGQISSFG